MACSIAAMNDSMIVRRERVATALGFTNEILVVTAGAPIPLPENTDQCYPFITHAEFAFLSDLEMPAALVAYDPKSPQGERWQDFTPLVTEAERVWEGRTQAPGRPLPEFEAWLSARKGRPLAVLGAGLSGVSIDANATQRARTRLHHARRPKDAGEIALMRQAAAATAAGYARVAGLIAPGVSERRIQIELEAEFLRGGASQPGFGTIVGAGSNSAVLHFSPSARLVADGDFVLIDSGAQFGRYTADVTRTFLVGAVSQFQRDLYQVVLDAQVRAIARCRPGVEWKDVHLGCAIDMMGGLRDMGLVKGDPQELVEREAHTLFFPHGIGHLVGLGVRDASGLLPGREKDPRPCLRTLRMDLPLEEGYIATVEPGLYFIPAILQDPVRRARYNADINWGLVDAHLHIGGVRIEDDVLVTAAGPDVLTAAIPK